MVAVTLFFSFSSISFPCFIGPLSFSLIRTYSWTYLSRGRWYCHLVSVEQPPTRARPGHAICPTDTCTLVGSGYTWPGELCRCVLCGCVPIVWNRILVRDAADVWTAFWKKRTNRPFPRVQFNKKTPIVVVAVVFWGFFSPFPLGGGWEVVTIFPIFFGVSFGPRKGFFWEH